jgi:uncharacterized protein (DUF2141 family)
MLRLPRLAVALLTLAGCGGSTSSAVPTITLAPGTAALRATIASVKVNTGPVDCELFNAAAGFPGASPILGGSLLVASTSDSVVCEYTQLPAGSYALIVYQDENRNGQLDTNVFGAPAEGYGASNDVLPATSAPSFKDSSVAVADAATVAITIHLKH